MRIVGFIFALAVIICLYGLLNLYAGRRLFQAIRYIFPSASVKIFAAVYIIVSLSIIIGFLPIPRLIDRVVSYVSSYWMGIFIYLVMIMFACDLVVLILRLIKVLPSPMSQQVRFYASVIAVLLTISVTSYGVYNARQVKNVSYNVQTSKADFTEDMKIVLVSDLHLGAVNSEKNLIKIVEGINKIKPDIVCIAGDIFNDDFYSIRNIEKAKELLQSIDSKYGVYASLGNHDGGKTFNQMTDFLSECNITLLNDEYVIIDERLVLVGRVDGSPIGGFDEIKRKGYSEVLSEIDTNLPVVVMDHTPSHVDEYTAEIDLVLSGHTHKGQLYPFGYITNALFTVDYGHYQKDSKSPNFIVTSGAGTWGMPMRVGSNSEIVTINLRSK